jgi:hypothetical protein
MHAGSARAMMVASAEVPGSVLVKDGEAIERIARET